MCNHYTFLSLAICEPWLLKCLIALKNLTVCKSWLLKCLAITRFLGESARAQGVTSCADVNSVWVNMRLRIDCREIAVYSICQEIPNLSVCKSWPSRWQVSLKDLLIALSVLDLVNSLECWTLSYISIISRMKFTVGTSDRHNSLRCAQRCLTASIISNFWNSLSVYSPVKVG